MASNQRQRPDINTASKEELTRAEGIDGTMADHIIRYREENGPFNSAEDLHKVPGVGETRFEQVRQAVSVQGGSQGGQGGNQQNRS